MRLLLRHPAIAAACLALSSLATLAAEPLVLEGAVPEEGAFFDVPFEVPEGIVELEVRHDDLSDANILDWGLEDPLRFRGYGGGNTEPAVVGLAAASRSYLAGPLPAGTWKVTVGKAKVTEHPARYRLEVHLRTEATLPPQPERTPYVPAAPLSSEARWYAGDFHVHSRESGDAAPSIDELASFARAQGLDFVLLSDHNTTSTLDFLVDAQPRHPELLLLPGVEYTTYRGHMNAVGATRYISPRADEPGGPTFPEVSADFAAQGAFVSINHPAYDVGDLCIGCAWQIPLPVGSVGGVELGTGGFDRLGRFFDEGAIAFWDWLLAQGHHVAALGGSDDHRAGQDHNLTQSPIAEPTTRVFASELSATAILEGLRAGRTVVQLAGPGDPMVELSSSVAPTGDTVLATGTTLRARITRAAGEQARWVHNGVALTPLALGSDEEALTLEVTAPEAAEDRWRLEVLVGGRVRTVTSHLWVSRDASFRGVPGSPPSPPGAQGCDCTSAAGPGMLAILSVLVAIGGRLRRRSFRA